MDLKNLAVFLKENSLPAFRLAQIKTAVYKNFASGFERITVLPEALRSKLKYDFRFSSLAMDKKQVSKKGDAVKFSFLLKDGLKIETVLLNLMAEKWSLCVSTQAGCPVRCPFCATGRKGLKRNLSPEEITDQFLAAAAYLKNENAQKIHSVVFMGMGEPFLNYDAVAEAIKTVIDPALIGLGQRHVSVSTAGHVPGIRRFAKDFPQINLALSLQSADNGLRDALVPLNRKYPLPQLARALKDYLFITKRRVFLEYVLLEKVNDSRSSAKKLLDWLKTVEALKYFNVNLIPYNETGRTFRKPSKEKVRAFHDYLLEMGIPVTLRRSLGEDIDGACGQLAGK